MTVTEPENASHADETVVPEPQEGVHSDDQAKANAGSAAEVHERAEETAKANAEAEKEERARQEAEEKARQEAEEKARQGAEEKARQEAEETARQEAEVAEKARLPAEGQAAEESETAGAPEADGHQVAESLGSPQSSTELAEAGTETKSDGFGHPKLVIFGAGEASETDLPPQLPTTTLGNTSAVRVVAAGVKESGGFARYVHEALPSIGLDGSVIAVDSAHKLCHKELYSTHIEPLFQSAYSGELKSVTFMLIGAQPAVCSSLLLGRLNEAENFGLLARLIIALFKQTRKDAQTHSFNITFSLAEAAGDVVKDLLDDAQSPELGPDDILGEGFKPIKLKASEVQNARDVPLQRVHKQLTPALNRKSTVIARIEITKKVLATNVTQSSVITFVTGLTQGNENLESAILNRDTGDLALGKLLLGRMTGPKIASVLICGVAPHASEAATPAETDIANSTESQLPIMAAKGHALTLALASSIKIQQTRGDWNLSKYRTSIETIRKAQH